MSLLALVVASCAARPSSSIRYPDSFDGVQRRSVATAQLRDHQAANLDEESSRPLFRFGAVAIRWMMQGQLEQWMPGGALPLTPGCIERSEERLSNGHVLHSLRAQECPAHNVNLGKLSYTGRITMEVWEGGSHTEAFAWTIEQMSETCRDEDGRLRREVRSYDGSFSRSGNWFAVDMVWESPLEVCGASASTALVYEGRLAQTETRVEVSGHGTVGNRGAGVARIQSEQVADIDVCRSEALSGWTRITSQDHIAEIRYDGERECTNPPQAEVFVDGVSQGMSGYACSMNAGGGGSWCPALGFLLLAYRRRRRR